MADTGAVTDGDAIHPIAALEALEELLARPCNLVIGGGHAVLGV